MNTGRAKFLRLLKHLRVLSEWIYVLIFHCLPRFFPVIKIAAFKHFYGSMVIFHEIFTVLISLSRPFYMCAKINPPKKLRHKYKTFQGRFYTMEFQ